MTTQINQINQPVNFDKLTGLQLAHVYNQLVGPKGQIKKFRTVGVARARVNQALDDKNLSISSIVTGPGGAPLVLTKAEATKTRKENGQGDPFKIPASLKRPVPTPEEETALKEKASVERRKALTKQRRKDKKIHTKARKRTHFKQTGETKNDLVIRLITQPDGATATEILKAFGGKKFIGTLSRQCNKRNLTYKSFRRDDGERVYVATK